MEAYGRPIQLRKELEVNLNALEFRTDLLAQVQSQKWLGRIGVAVGSVMAVPIIEDIVSGTYDAVPARSYGGIAMAALGAVVSKYGATRQRKVEKETQQIAQSTDTLVDFMSIIGNGFNLPELDCSKLNLHPIERYLPPQT